MVLEHEASLKYFSSHYGVFIASDCGNHGKKKDKINDNSTIKKSIFPSFLQASQTSLLYSVCVCVCYTCI